MIFRDALHKRNKQRPPVWMMRQAGRYHSHYRMLKEKYTFLELCKHPDLACEVTMGPINAFDFDAAILFSDILFPLEVLGTPLDFAPGPQLGFLLQSPNDLSRYRSDPDITQLNFQADALRLIRQELPMEKGLIGFVGGMLTLYVFAVHGTHKTVLDSARAGFDDGRFDGFMQRIMPVMLQNMMLQAKTPIDALAIFESCAGDIAPQIFHDRYLPYLHELLRQFRTLCPDTPLIYYGKNIGPCHWQWLKDLSIQCLGIDYQQDLTRALLDYPQLSVQGNFDPVHLTLSPAECETQIRDFFARAYALPDEVLKRWVCGTGHGLTPQVREENVRRFIVLGRELWEDRQPCL